MKNSITLPKLRDYANKEAKIFTQRTIDVQLVDIEKVFGVKHGGNIGLLGDPSDKDAIFRIYIHKPLFQKYKDTNPEKLKGLVLHELAHIPQLLSDVKCQSHGKEFLKSCRRINVPIELRGAKLKKTPNRREF